MFQNIPTTNPEPTAEGLKKATTFDRYRRTMVCGKIHNLPPPLKDPNLRKRRKEEEKIIKGKINQENTNWSDRRLQINWKKL